MNTDFIIADLNHRILDSTKRTQKWLTEFKIINDHLNKKKNFRNNNLDKLIIYMDKSGKLLSLRIHGEEIAVMSFDSAGKPNVKITSNKFGLKENDNMSWRDFSKKVSSLKLDNIHSEEHRIEMFFYKELTKRKNKQNFFKNKTPIRLGKKYFFQFPLAVGASGNKLRKVGHIDILIRKGKGKTSSLEVWELKKEYDKHAVFQSLIYALQIKRLLEDRDWSEFIGYDKNLPSKISAVAFYPRLNESQIVKVKQEINKYSKLAIKYGVHLSYKEFFVNTQSQEISIKN